MLVVDQLGCAFCSVSPARCAGSSLTCAKRTAQLIFKEEGPHGPGDTKQNVHPMPDAKQVKCLLQVDAFCK
jgi:hypothetical protein